MINIKKIKKSKFILAKNADSLYNSMWCQLYMTDDASMAQLVERRIRNA